MSIRLVLSTVAACALALPVTAAEPLALDFENGVSDWRIVVDGVMGGRSSGRTTLAAAGVLQFSGDLSLENNGGFSQMRSTVSGAELEDADGIEIRVRGDGRTYKFDIRCSHVQMMAGGFQQEFTTRDGAWTTVRLPFDRFRLYSFGRQVRDAPSLIPANIESIGVTLSDKQPGPFQLQVDWIRAYGAGIAAAGAGGDDLVTVARAAGLDALLDLVTAAELELPDQRVTILAPTDEAFSRIPESARRDLLRPENRAALRSILAYHVIGSPLSSTELLMRRTVDTLNGQRVDVAPDGAPGIGPAGFVVTDVSFDGGVVHVIDTVLMPQSKSITDLAAETSELSTLTTAVVAAGLGDQLGSENGPFTVFAPIDDAFAELPTGTLESLTRPENRSQLVQILGLHVVPGRLYASELLANRQARTFFGSPVEFGTAGGRLRVGDANIVRADIEAGNGVIHFIDRVLLPTDPPADRTMMMTRRPSHDAVKRILELAIERGVPLFNDGQHAACAAIYEVAIEATIAFGGFDAGSMVRERLEMALAEADSDSSWGERAWTYRRAMDDVYERLAQGSANATASR
ncbi:MAG: CIA30 family protein [Planctomycetota bacterium]